MAAKKTRLEVLRYLLANKHFDNQDEILKIKNRDTPLCVSIKTRNLYHTGYLPSNQSTA